MLHSYFFIAQEKQTYFVESSGCDDEKLVPSTATESTKKSTKFAVNA